VAVAASLCAAAVGTETDGSIICPSTHNGIVGIKPTLGLVSRTGIVPIAHSQDTAGPMARTVADAAVLLGVLAGIDPADPITAEAPADRPPDYTAGLRPDGLRGARIGVARQYGRFHERCERLLDQALTAMHEQGAEIIDPAEIATKDRLGEPEFEVLLYEFKADLNAYLASLGPQAPIHDLAEVIAFNEAHRDRVMPYFGQEVFELAQAKGPLTEPAYLKAREDCRRLARGEGIDATLTAHRLDAIVALSGGPAWPIDLVLGDHGLGGSSTPAAVAGYPSITVPAGQVYGLPVGISFIGAAYREPALLRLAYAYEQATLARRPPRYLPTAELGS
jgi:amidase